MSSESENGALPPELNPSAILTILIVGYIQAVVGESAGRTALLFGLLV